MKNKNGITLISLVITIVIMLILAGVSINLILGNNGLFGKSKTSADKYKQAALDEELQINSLDYDSLLENEETITEAKKVYLYKYGNEYADVTGGWDFFVFNYSPKYVRNEDNIELIGNGDSCCNLYTKNKIKLQGYSKLVMEVAGIGDIHIMIGYDTEYGGANIKYKFDAGKKMRDGTKEILELEIPKDIDNTEYYLKFLVGYLGDNKNAYLYSAYLEE